MLKNQQITFFVKRYSMSNVYISTQEAKDIYQNLSQPEYMVYVTVKGMVLGNHSPEDLSNKFLGKELGVSDKSIANAKSSLKKKGYLVIDNFKDANGSPRADVFIGKDQVELYNLGLKYSIADAKIYKELTKKFRFLDQSLSLEERKAEIDKANEYCLSLQK